MMLTAGEFALRDGTRILVRPIVPQDKERLRQGFARLSARSRYRRFLTALDHLSDEQVRYLTEIDYADHMAWIALDPSQPGQPGVGVARYLRLPQEPTVAEAAVTVLDNHQGRGIGTILLRLLAESALKHGIGSFRGYVLAEPSGDGAAARPWRDPDARGVAAAHRCSHPAQPRPTSRQPGGPAVQVGGQPPAPRLPASRKLANWPTTVRRNNIAGAMVVLYGQQMTAALLASFPTLLVYLLLGRFFMRGLMAGALKG